MEKLTEKELEILKEKARKYDELEAKIEEFYDEEDYNMTDLVDIGEYVAQYFGWT